MKVDVEQTAFCCKCQSRQLYFTTFNLMVKFHLLSVKFNSNLI